MFTTLANLHKPDGPASRCVGPRCRRVARGAALTPVVALVQAACLCLIVLLIMPRDGSAAPLDGPIPDGGGSTLHPNSGLAALQNRLGSEAPTGAGIAIVHVEGGNSSGYGPNQGSSQMAGKYFFEMSGAAGYNSHAQMVANQCYSIGPSIAPGVSEIWLWRTMNWLQIGWLRASSVDPSEPDPTPPGVRVFNHSWALNGGLGFDLLVLRKADFAVVRDDVLMIAGVPNSTQPMAAQMSFMHNGITVGRADGKHWHGFVPTGYDGPGRIKPDMVAHASTTSAAVPLVAGAASLLIETAYMDPMLYDDPQAASQLVIKATLMAGTTHRPNWTNNPIPAGALRGFTAVPLDPKFGVDRLDVNRSHMILTGGRTSGNADVGATTDAPEFGWDRWTMAAGDSRWWRFHTDHFTGDISVIATWNREVSTAWNAYTSANIDLELYAEVDGVIEPLLGDLGLYRFIEGNVVSADPVGNVEHIYLRDLAPGTYWLQARRNDQGTPTDVAIAWAFPGVVVRDVQGDGPIIGEPPSADLNGDGYVDGADLGILLTAWGSDNPMCDLNQDGKVDSSDLGILLQAWFGG